MATVDSLRRRVATMRAEIDKSRKSRQWSITLEEGEEIAEELRKQLGPYDIVFVRYFPRGYMPEHSQHGQVMSCWLPGPRGHQVAHVVREYGVDTSKV